MTADGATVAAPSGPLGILAGGGALPTQIAEMTLASGRSVQIVGIVGEADPGIERFTHTWANWGAIGHMVTSLRRAGCRDVMFIGSVKRPDWRTVRPDLGLVRAIPTIIRLFGGGDDHVLRRVVRFFETQGFEVRGVGDVAPALLATTGSWGQIAPAPTYLADAVRGFGLIEALGFADVGQAVVMHQGRAVAIEAAEGTDRMLARLGDGDQRRAIGGVLVKGPKPGQELRIDMPAIGPRTVELAAKAGLAGIAVRSGQVLSVERARIVAAADAAGLFIAGIEPQGLIETPRRVVPLSALTRLAPSKDQRRDMARALNVLAAASRFADTSAVIVVRRHVIAIETGEGLVALFERANTLRQWGATQRSKRRGAIAIDGQIIDEPASERLVDLAIAAGLAGIVLPATPVGSAVDALCKRAEAAGLSVVEAPMAQGSQSGE